MSNFIPFLDVLEKYAEQEIFSTDLVNAITSIFWSDYEKQIFVKVYYPFAVYFSFVQIYFLTCIDPATGLPHDGFVEWFFRNVIRLLNYYFLFLEYIQFSQKDSWKDYFFDIFNLIDLVTGILILIMMTTFSFDAIDFGSGAERWMGIATLMIWLKLFNMLQIYESYSHYIRMIAMTLEDIKHFFVLFIIMIFTFGVTVNFFNTSRVRNAHAHEGE